MHYSKIKQKESNNFKNNCFLLNNKKLAFFNCTALLKYCLYNKDTFFQFACCLNCCFDIFQFALPDFLNASLYGHSLKIKAAEKVAEQAFHWALLVLNQRKKFRSFSLCLELVLKLHRQVPPQKVDVLGVGVAQNTGPRFVIFC